MLASEGQCQANKTSPNRVVGNSPVVLFVYRQTFYIRSTCSNCVGDAKSLHEVLETQAQGIFLK